MVGLNLSFQESLLLKLELHVTAKRCFLLISLFIRGSQLKLPIQDPGQVCDHQNWNPSHQSGCSVSALSLESTSQWLKTHQCHVLQHFCIKLLFTKSLAEGNKRWDYTALCAVQPHQTSQSLQAATPVCSFSPAFVNFSKEGNKATESSPLM